MRLCTDRIGLVIYGRRSSIGVGGYEGEKEDEKERKMMGMGGGGEVKVFFLCEGRQPSCSSCYSAPG